MDVTGEVLVSVLQGPINRAGSVSHPRPAVGQELAALPVAGREEEESSDDHEDPDHQVDHVEDVVEAHWVAHAESDDHRDQQGDEEGQQVGVCVLALTWYRDTCFLQLVTI